MEPRPPLTSPSPRTVADSPQGLPEETRAGRGLSSAPPAGAGDDSWDSIESSAARWQRAKRVGRQVGGQVARRGVSLAVLLLLAGLGTLLLLGVLLVLGIGVANGSAPAGWLLATALLGVLGLLWTGWKAARLLRTPLTLPPAAASAEENDLLRLLRQHERALPPATRPALHATVIATRDALRATAGDTTLSRAAFDARQAAREDLPDLLTAYRALPDPTANEAALLEQLRLIEQRMVEVRHERTPAQQRTLAAHGHYLTDKYRKNSE
ncbi:hypothetical protein DVJ83_07745 [Deinococcus wulumuqiensis]|uniref:Uncharacterized protein n=1 Tax=Deinococcus wulumuqiensis TaxID=980427 RepID=A0A345IH98_9DEIO|nr:hypothetical protein [Deinococcus wulumuqiensis]AXG99070.1 hypothetical protein DVJ83_07745 [Deinococcus wulumuqiensis]